MYCIYIFACFYAIKAQMEYATRSIAPILLKDIVTSVIDHRARKTTRRIQFLFHWFGVHTFLHTHRQETLSTLASDNRSKKHMRTSKQNRSKPVQISLCLLQHIEQTERSAKRHRKSMNIRQAGALQVRQHCRGWKDKQHQNTSNTAG